VTQVVVGYTSGLEPGGVRQRGKHLRDGPGSKRSGVAKKNGVERGGMPLIIMIRAEKVPGSSLQKSIAHPRWVQQRKSSRVFDLVAGEGVKGGLG